jgi:hypothetical protein
MGWDVVGMDISTMIACSVGLVAVLTALHRLHRIQLATERVALELTYLREDMRDGEAQEAAPAAHRPPPFSKRAISS